MKIFQILVFTILLSIEALSQINMNDSTVQVIGYWSNNEKQSYIITEEKFKIKDSDTTSREIFKYAVDVTISDSTANSYVIDWLFKDYEVQTDNEIIKN